MKTEPTCPTGWKQRGPDIKSSLTYVSTGRGTTELLAKLETKVGTDVAVTDTLTYDAAGKVTAHSSHTYRYDPFGRLVHAEDTAAKCTWDYTYDESGNLLSATETAADGSTDIEKYVYHKKQADRLVNFDGQCITYGKGGNPSTYLGNVLKWKHGRMLAEVGKNISYTYTQDGMRLSKTLSGKRTDYLINNGTILVEKRAGEKLNYYYSAEGKLLEIGYVKDGESEHRYSVLRNAMGDVTDLYTASGARVGGYRYDPWGKLLAQETESAASDPDDILTKNPFRYRGYYYDTETGWYYLQSRYYDPAVKRFLNADTPDLLTADCTNLMQYNLYAYCCNNPVNNQDDSGHMSNWQKVAIGTAVIAGLGILALATGGAGLAVAGVAMGARKGNENE